jgi:Spy/CpxP family protein refolding chaperone
MLFRTFVFLTFLSASTVSLFAQVPALPPKDVIFFSHAAAGPLLDAGEASDELISKVRATLSLSDAQVAALKTLLSMRSKTIAQIHQTAIETQTKLEDLVGQPNPDPNEVGAAFLATRSVHDQLEAAQEKFRLDFRSSLSTEQRATLDKLQVAADQTGSLTALGILAGPIDGPFVVQGPNSESGIAIGFQRRLSNHR